MKHFYPVFLITFLVLFFNSNKTNAQTLVAGDIAFIGWNTDSPDAFAFVTLTDIPSSEPIYFTDRGAAGAAWGPSPEDMALFTAPSGGIPCGTVVTVTDTKRIRKWRCNYWNYRCNLGLVLSAKSEFSSKHFQPFSW